METSGLSAKLGQSWPRSSLLIWNSMQRELRRYEYCDDTCCERDILVVSDACFLHNKWISNIHLFWIFFLNLGLPNCFAIYFPYVSGDFNFSPNLWKENRLSQLEIYRYHIIGSVIVSLLILYRNGIKFYRRIFSLNPYIYSIILETKRYFRFRRTRNNLLTVNSHINRWEIFIKIINSDIPL